MDYSQTGPLCSEKAAVAWDYFSPSAAGPGCLASCCALQLSWAQARIHTHTQGYFHIKWLCPLLMYSTISWHGIQWSIFWETITEIHVSSPLNTAEEQASVVWVYPCVTMAHTVCPIRLWDYARWLHNVLGIWAHMFLCMFVGCKKGL